MDAFAALGSADDRPLPPPPRAGGMMMQPPLEMPAMPDPMGGSAAISTAMHAWTPATFSPPLLGLRAERAVDYMGEKASMFSFFTNFYTIILRKRGSALPKIMIEIFLATCLGVVAYLLTEDGLCDAKKCKGFFLPPSTSREKGHAMIGVLLAFLVVFRSQIAWGMYMEGRNAVGRVVAMSRCLALELLASLAHACVEEGISEKQSLGVSRSGRPRVEVRRGGVTLPELRRSASTIRRTKKSDIELAVLALECVRLIKLHYWTQIEHVRSTDGEEAWTAAAEMVNRFATAPEVAELRAEFGGVQPGSQRNKVTIPGTGDDGPEKKGAPASLKRGESFRVGSSLPYHKRTSGSAVAQQTHDPTRSKPLVVLTWLRINIERMVSAGALETTQLSRLTEQIEGLVEAGGAIDKIDRMVLPLPYCQLLKIFQIFFVFTLPFVLAPQLGLWTPIVAAFTAIGFFGLDQVGVELEGPFGVDDNDFPLLTMGLAMCNDLDAMVRTVSRTRMEARLTSFASTESHQIQGAAALALGWAEAAESS